MYVSVSQSSVLCTYSSSLPKGDGGDAHQANIDPPTTTLVVVQYVANFVNLMQCVRIDVLHSTSTSTSLTLPGQVCNHYAANLSVGAEPARRSETCMSQESNNSKDPFFPCFWLPAIGKGGFGLGLAGVIHTDTQMRMPRYPKSPERNRLRYHSRRAILRSNS